MHESLRKKTQISANDAASGAAAAAGSASRQNGEEVVKKRDCCQQAVVSHWTSADGRVCLVPLLRDEE